MNKSYRNLIRNSLWALAGNTGSKILSFLLLPFYTRWLGTAGYGLSDLITTYSSFLLGVVTLCAADGIFIFTKNRTQTEKSEYFTSTLKFVAVLFVGWFLVVSVFRFVASYYDIHNSFTDNVWLITAFVLSSFLQSFTQQFLIGIEQIKLYSFTGMILCISTFILSVLLIPGWGVKGYVYSLFLANMFTSLFSFLLSGSYRYFSMKGFQWERVRELLVYSIPLIPNAIMWWMVSALNRPIMEAYLGFSDIGIFAVANKFPGIITMVFSVFAVSWNISVLEEYSKPTFSEFYHKVFKILFMVLMVVTLMLMLCSQYIIMLFAAPQFAEAWRYMVLLIMGAFFSCFSSFFGTVFGVVKKSKYFFYSSVYGATVSIILNFILIPVLGLVGACISVVSSFFVSALSRYYYSRKYVVSSLMGDVMFYSILLIAFSFVLLNNRVLYLNIGVFVLCVMLMAIRERNYVFQIKSVLDRIGK